MYLTFSLKTSLAKWLWSTVLDIFLQKMSSAAIRTEKKTRQWLILMPRCCFIDLFRSYYGREMWKLNRLILIEKRFAIKIRATPDWLNKNIFMSFFSSQCILLKLKRQNQLVILLSYLLQNSPWIYNLNKQTQSKPSLEPEETVTVCFTLLFL